MVDHHEELTRGEAEAEKLARDIYSAFESQIDTSFENWHTNESILDAFEVEIIEYGLRGSDPRVRAQIRF